MANSLDYETPENIQLRYEIAGLGTRFVAWFVDMIILWVILFCMLLLLLILAAATSVFQDFFARMVRRIDPDKIGNPETWGVYFIGIATLVMGLFSFGYFGLSELMLRGQTLGKRICKIRVVKADGFSLDTVSVILRNLLSAAEHIPLFWVVPLLSRRSQRLGDMAAGTLVVSDRPRPLPNTRETFQNRATNEARYRFDHVKLGRLRPSDVEAVERIVENWSKLPSAQRAVLGDRMSPALCKRMQVDEPPSNDRHIFLEDLLAAEYRRQERRLR